MVFLFFSYETIPPKIISGCPRSGKKSGKKVCSRSGYCQISQGILHFQSNSWKSQGILESQVYEDIKNNGYGIYSYASCLDFMIIEYVIREK